MPAVLTDTGRAAFLDVNGFARDTGWLHLPMELYAAYGVVLFAALMLAGWWLARRDGSPTRMAAALWTPVGMLLALALAQPVAAAVAERRPFVTLPHILVLAQHARDYGFPSDHTTMAGAVAAGALLVNRRLGLLATAAALLLAFSRVYIAVHFPQDVLAGLLLGAAVVLLGHLLLAPVLRRAIGWAGHRAALRALLTTTPVPDPLAPGGQQDRGVSAGDPRGSSGRTPSGSTSATPTPAPPPSTAATASPSPTMPPRIPPNAP